MFPLRDHLTMTFIFPVGVWNSCGTVGPSIGRSRRVSAVLVRGGRVEAWNNPLSSESMRVWPSRRRQRIKPKEGQGLRSVGDNQYYLYTLALFTVKIYIFAALRYLHNNNVSNGNFQKNPNFTIFWRIRKKKRSRNQSTVSFIRQITFTTSECFPFTEAASWKPRESTCTRMAIPHTPWIFHRPRMSAARSPRRATRKPQENHQMRETLPGGDYELFIEPAGRDVKYTTSYTTSTTILFYELSNCRSFYICFDIR